MDNARKDPAGQRSVRRRLLVWILGSLAGALVVALPDSGARLFSLSRTHGPSLVDLLGIVMLVAAWLPIAMLLWSSRAAIRGPWAAGTLLLGGAGLLLLVVSIAGDTGDEWMLGAALLLGPQLLALVALYRLNWNGKMVVAEEGLEPPTRGL